MGSLWSVSKLSTESVGSRRELVDAADATKQFPRRNDETVDETRQFCRVGGVYWA